MSLTISSKKILIAVLFCLAVLPLVRAQDANDLDNYKWRVDGDWWYSDPSGYFGDNKTNNYFDINKDFGFGSYSTFTGKLDWHFAHKHHFLLAGTPNSTSKTSTLSRTIMFAGQTFDVGAAVTASLDGINIAPGYQYDIIRRDHGYLGLEIDLNFIQTTGKLSLAGNAGSVAGSATGSRTFWAPVPDFGPVFRWYPLHDSNRLSFGGSFRGMPFFGYGNYMTGRADVGVGLTRHLNIRGGYQMGTRLSIHGTADQVAIQVTHKGPTAGIEYSFGESPAKKVHNPNAPPSDWHVDWIPFYLWFTGLSGNVGANGYVVPVSVSFSQVIQQLNIGWMTDLDVRRKRIGLFTDLIFMSLSSDQKTTPVGPGPTYLGFQANAKQLIVDPELYVRLVDKDRGSIDAIGGGRFWDLNNSLDLFPPSGTTITAGQTQTWVDPVLGARARLNANKGIFFNLKGDAGGFGVGSQLTYQIYAGMGKEFKKKYSVLLGYRYLYVDYKSGGFLYDVHMSGLQAGFNIRFK
ncbi:MAG: hypothetical protein WA830_07625 [Candidatus Sulfotelmatobacter sp.]